MKSEKKEVEILIKAGKEAGRKAQEENFLLGLPVVIAEKGKIIEIDKNGNRREIGKIDNSNANYES